MSKPLSDTSPSFLRSRHASATPGEKPLWARLLGALVAPWLKIDILCRVPEDSKRAVCYVFEQDGLSNLLILDEAAREAGLPPAFLPMPLDEQAGAGHRAAFALHNRGQRRRAYPVELIALVQAHRRDPSLDVELIPVSMFVGRAPTRSKGWFSVLFAETWGLGGRMRRLMALLLNGRDTHVRFAVPVSLRTLVDEGQAPERTVRKLARTLRSHFRGTRTAVVGPDLSTRRVVIDQLMASPSVRDAIADHARRSSMTADRATKQALSFALEIAADYSHPAVRSLSFILKPVWNRLYRGISVRNLDAFKDASRGYEVIYVPSHRSHMDYLLLSYILYTHSIVPPHIAAGVNLNLPLVGRVLRKCGAFYLRRNIKGSPLYSAVFSEYMAQLISRGYSIEYFIEGGRSRTGRLQQPKAGTLSMTVRAFLRERSRPVMFQPVYIGYEKIMEGGSYIDELSGAAKKNESIWKLITSLPGVLRSRYGQVVVNFGQPVYLADVLDASAPGWEAEASPGAREKPAWLTRAIDDLAMRININVNAAADVNPVNLLATALLSAPRHAMAESDLLAHLALLKTLLSQVVYDQRVTVTGMTPEQMVGYGLELGVLERVKHELGDVLRIREADAVLLSWYRNNSLHLFVAAGVIANCLMQTQRMPLSRIRTIARHIYAFVKAELFLPWDEAGFMAQMDSAHALLLREGLLVVTGEPGQEVVETLSGDSDGAALLRGVGQPLRQALERYYITMAVLVKNGSGTLSTGQLETICHYAAQRLSLLHAKAAPEFFDKSLFRVFIHKLRDSGLVRLNDAGCLVFDDTLALWARDARELLGRELRHAIERIVPEAGKAT
ncbi:glycerol-3-phosphate O-acyltransferase [Luteibacter sp. Sphag1AF]|uniref:glycerol-3-phosphate 1-O-acyltransferase PlsB n=1 Tax=Luteibacter sp. Sphag1AF TaxID=2587031 RepID=UPI001610E364|nr:glycerol-3-phosphate 1-O-acyltransferase PlsB [Luteibacter sp. Sphag1AF]MBB3228871.1 glycerol-3-phosphate O-acyltransferase [Luteibacter sp. Sphag1AF]